MCKSGCAECCGVVPFNRRTFARLKGKAQKPFKEAVLGDTVWPSTADGVCVFLNPKKECEVYPNRPDVCRQYGEIAALPCPYFKRDGTPRSEAEIREKSEEIDRQVSSDLRRMMK